jgi:phycoerythrin-associated linker protein
MTGSSAATENAGAWSPNGMSVEEFFTRSIGTWRSLRSSHNIAFGQIEEVNSNIDISTVSAEDPELIQICDVYKADPKNSCSSVR